MRRTLCVALAAALLGGLGATLFATSSPAGSTGAADPAAGKPGVKLENLLRSELAGAEGLEVIVSRVTLPPHTALPKHWHPGEEFGYVLDGSMVLWQDGKEDIVGKKGDVMMVPLKQVHTAMTRDEGATVLVFRVHEVGQPERIPVGPAAPGGQ